MFDFLRKIKKRIKYKILYKKAVQYLKCIDYSVLIQTSEKVQSYHINKKAEIGTEYLRTSFIR